ncbi:MAG: hypothetical protein ACE5GX_16525 [Thermoanaerobaculia bacterium]
MKHSNRPLARTLAVVGLLLGALFTQGCVLDFTGDNFQRLKTFFKLTEAFATGEASLVHTWFFPASVVVKKNWVQVSGAATAPEGGVLPSTVTVTARFEDMDTGKQQQKITLKVKLKPDGTFSARKKIKKNVSADSLLMVTIRPVGNDLEVDTELTLCVDIAEKKGDLNGLPACVEGDANGGPATLTELQNDIFTPGCDSFGCHNADSARGGLVLTAGMSFDELVNVPSSQLPQFDRVEPGDPENSYLIHKLRGDPGIFGARMPVGGAFLTDAELARVVSWINDGAPNN